VKRLLSAGAFVLACALPAHAAPTVEWQSLFGGPDEQRIVSAEQIAGGDYLVAGVHLVQPGNPIHGGSEAFLLARVDADGSPRWQRTYELALMSWGANAVEAGDGGFVMVGTAHVQWNYFDSRIALIKTDADGNLLWTRFFTENRPHTIDNTHGLHVQRTADGGYIVLGGYYSYMGASTILLIRTDADGNELWRTRPGDPLTVGSQVRQTADGGFAVCGSISRDENDYDTYDFYFLKTDASGAAAWSVSHGTAFNDACGSFRQTADGGYALFGNTLRSGVENSSDFALLKIDGSGTPSFFTVWGAPGDDWAGGLVERAEGGFLTSGTRRALLSEDAIEQLEVTQLSAAGQRLSGILLGEPSWSGQPYAGGVSIERTDDGGFIVGGITIGLNEGSATYGDPDVYLVKLAPLAGGATIPVAIDVKPGNAANTVNTTAEGTTPVAILGTPDFDPAQVDPATVTLAGAPVAATKQGRFNVSIHDVDHDGIADLLVHIVTAGMQVEAGGGPVTLVGQTFAGEAIEGADVVRAVK
jgi:hypothetical protein